MSRRTEQAYTAVFEYLHENVMELNCEIFMSDYENALRNGFSRVVPNVHMTACWLVYHLNYHFSILHIKFVSKN